MKRAAGLAIIALTLVSGACTRIGPGYVGIKVSMAGDQKGVQSLPIQTGWVFYNPLASSVFEWPTFVQTAKWTKSLDEGNPVNEEITFTNADQMQIAADISISYHLEAEKVPSFYVKFRTDHMDEFTHGFLRNLARDTFDRFGGKYKIEQIMGDNAGFLDDVRKSLQEEVASIGIVLDQFGFIGAPRPPAAIQQAINDKAQAAQISQQKEQEVKQAEADARKEVAKTEGYARSVTIRAEAEAAANRKIAESITPTLVELRRLEKWNGALPQVAGTANPFITLK